MEEESDIETDIDMYSETESSEQIIYALNTEIEQLAEKANYCKTKTNEKFNSMLKLHFENEQLKKQNNNLKSLLISKLPPFLNAIIDYL